MERSAFSPPWVTLANPQPVRADLVEERMVMRSADAVLRSIGDRIVP
jgi:hypothetical protein